jgi:endoglucanase
MNVPLLRFAAAMAVAAAWCASSEAADPNPPTEPAAIGTAAKHTASGPAAAVFALNRRLGRGINIIGWDPLWQDFSRARFADEHFRLISEAGFNHVRVNLHPLRDGKPDASGKMEPAFFKTLDWCIDRALANKLLVVLDYHDDLAVSPDPSGKRESFLATWSAIAEHCKDRPADVLFEVLNEPAPKFTYEIWNQYHKDALAVIRRTNPSRTVIIGPAMWNGVGELEKLVLPEDDRNIIATFHYFNPFDFTHQGTPWTGQRDKIGVTWEATASQGQAVLDDFAKAERWAEKHNRPLYLGEFGAYEKADMASRVRYISFVAREAEKRGWSWAYWQFDGDFIAFDIAKKQWVESIREALIPAHK